MGLAHLRIGAAVSALVRRQESGPRGAWLDRERPCNGYRRCTNVTRLLFARRRHERVRLSRCLSGATRCGLVPVRGEGGGPNANWVQGSFERCRFIVVRCRSWARWVHWHWLRCWRRPAGVMPKILALTQGAAALVRRRQGLGKRGRAERTRPAPAARLRAPRLPRALRAPVVAPQAQAARAAHRGRAARRGRRAALVTAGRPVAAAPLVAAAHPVAVPAVRRVTVAPRAQAAPQATADPVA